ncbi:MAG: glutathione synthase [Alphaproteobacteria bacterium]
MNDLSVNFIMPDLATLRVQNVSAIALGMEAERRGYKICHTCENDITYKEGKVIARVRDASQIKPEQGRAAVLSDYYDMNLNEVDINLLRISFNYDLKFVTALGLLELIQDQTLIVDKPSNLRHCAGKLFLNYFQDVMAPTLISSDINQILRFREEYKDIIVKPLFGYGGEGIFHIKPSSDNLNSLLGMFDNLYHEPIMIQRYLPDVKGGDKRVLLIDGEPVGAILRTAPKDNVRTNVSSGGSMKLSELTKSDLRICEAVKPIVKKLGLVLVGLDVIGDYLIEINVGNVGGLIEYDMLGGGNLASTFWDAVEKRL